MSKKYNRLEPKTPVITLVVMAVTILLVIGLIVLLTPSAKQNIYTNYKTGTNASLPTISKDHPFEEIKYQNGFLGIKKGLESKINSEEVVFLLLSSPNCTACQTYIGLFEEYFNNPNHEDTKISQFSDKIYYINPSEDTKSFNGLAEDFEIEAGTPQFIVFYNKEILVQLEISTLKNEHRNVFDFYKQIITKVNENKST